LKLTPKDVVAMPFQVLTQFTAEKAELQEFVESIKQPINETNERVIEANAKVMDSSNAKLLSGLKQTMNILLGRPTQSENLLEPLTISNQTTLNANSKTQTNDEKVASRVAALLEQNFLRETPVPFPILPAVVPKLSDAMKSTDLFVNLCGTFLL
jgi:hypothetical protein